MEMLKILARVFATAGLASFRSLELIPSGPGDLEMLSLDKISETFYIMSSGFCKEDAMHFG